MPINQSFNIQHKVTLYGQPTNMTCWSAATTMLFGTTFSAGPGRAATAANGGLLSDETNIQTFARAYGLQLHWPQTWTVEGLVDLLENGPVVMAGAMPRGHAVVIAGIRGDGTPGGTQLTIYDPWPPNVGAILRVNYGVFMTRFPMATMYLLQR